MVKKNKSAKIEIKLDEAAIQAFEKIKIELQAQVELCQPDFSKPFELTTDASNLVIGAALAQNRKPIAFISRILSDTKQSYSTNEKELLAIVWALQKLRNYLYGVADLTIYTDHQSLIYFGALWQPFCFGDICQIFCYYSVVYAKSSWQVTRLNSTFK